MVDAAQKWLVETEWLATHLGDPALRIFDCTTHLDPDPVAVFKVRSARPDWEGGHIPGSDHLDLQGELSDRSSPLRFTMPSAEQFAEAMSRRDAARGAALMAEHIAQGRDAVLDAMALVEETTDDG